MHGVTLWKDRIDSSSKEDVAFKLEIEKENVSNLYTWQDGRCDTNFLQTLPQSESHLPVHTGYGCATLFWFARNRFVLEPLEFKAIGIFPIFEI